MPTCPITRRALTGLLATAPLAARAQSAPAERTAALDLVASFDAQVTGVAVAPSGRIFVNFPRWEQDVPISVAEITKDGTLRPYPDAEWNRWTDAAPLSNANHFICVQSVTVDAQGFLWIVDPAAPGNEFNLDGGPKVVKVDLGQDRVVRVYPFNRNVCPQGSYLNDIRVSPDGRTAYLSDSGVRGALLVLDVASGQVRRLLDGHPSTQVEKMVKVTVGGKPLQRADGRGPMFAADGIALNVDGSQLYWQALTGKTLYRIPTSVLRSGALPPARVAAAVERLGTTCVADGYWIDRQDRFWITSPEDDSVKRRMPDGSMRVAVQDARLRWPDSMAQGADGSIYVTASHIQDMAQFTAAPRKGKTELFRFNPST